MRLKDVIKGQPKRKLDHKFDRKLDRKRDRKRDRDRGVKTKGGSSNSNSNSNNIRGNIRGNIRDRNCNAALRKDQEQKTKQRKEPLPSKRKRKKFVLIAAPTANINKSSVPHQKPCRAAVGNHAPDDDDESSSSSSDEEDQIPYKMNFSQSHHNEKRKNVESSDSDDDDSDDDGGGYESPPYYEDGNSQEKQKQQSAEPLRPGDVIEYQNTMIFAAGSNNHNTARVVGTTPGAKFPLKLSTGDYLYDSVRVRRTHEFVKGELYKHSGYWKPISEFRLRKRVLMLRDNNDSSQNGRGRPVEGGILGTVRALKDFREGLHKTAVEFMRGDHDNDIDNKMAVSTTNKNERRPTKKATAATADFNISATGNDDGDDDGSSSSSSDGSELRLEFERLKEEREKKQKQHNSNNNNKSSSSKSPTSLLPEDTDSDDSDTANDSCNNDGVSRNPTLSDGVTKGKSSFPSKQPSLVLKKISRTAASITANTKVSDCQIHNYNCNTENDELHRATPFNRTKKKNHPSKTPKSIDIPIDIGSKNKERKSPENVHSSSYHSRFSILSSSSCISTAKRTTRPTPKTKKRHSRLVTMTTVASKVEDARRSEELLESDDDDDSLLLGNPIFAAPKSSGTPIVPKTSNRNSNEKHPFSRRSNSKPQHYSPMEENPVDLFEDSSGDDDSSRDSICRKRNRRGERMLRSPSIDLRHRNNKRPNVDVNTGVDGILWCTQDDHGKSNGVQGTQQQLPLSAVPSHRAVKRSVVVGYRPLSFSVGKRQEDSDKDSGEDESSPPSLAKAYRKREEAKQQQQQQQRECEGHSRNRVINEQHDDGMGSPDRGKKQTQNKERPRMKALEKKDSNRRKLQRKKQKLKKQQERPPPYPRQRLNHQDREDDIIIMSSTQENEWTDCENDEPSFHRSNHKKCRNHKRDGAKATTTLSSSLSSDSEPTPPKRSRNLTQKRNPNNNWNSSSDGDGEYTRNRQASQSRRRNNFSEADSKPREQRNRIKQKHRRYELNSSSSSEGGHQKIPRTPWSTDCEVDSPPPSAVVVVGGKHHNPTAKDSPRASRHSSNIRSSSNTKTKLSVFDFSSHDENEDSPAMEGFCTKRHISPKLLGSSKRKSFKPKMTRKPKAK